METPSFLTELKRRRVVRALIAYGAIVFGVVQVLDPIFAGLMLPDVGFRIVVIASIVGFPVVAALAWVYEITADGVCRTSDSSDGSTGRVPAHRYLQLIGAFTLVTVLIVVTAGAFGRMQYPASDDGRIGIAVFPLRATDGALTQWSEGTADLIATALEGNVAMRIVDPWSLWRPLRARSGDPARSPEVEEAERLAEAAGAHRFLLGAVAPGAEGVEATFRLYQVGRAEPLDAFRVGAEPDDLLAVAREAAVRTLARAWGARRPPEIPAELDFDATSSPAALNSYLAAKEAMRRGMLDSANVAIDRALGHDSTFVLGIVEAVLIKSWGRSVRGQPYGGLFEMLARAEPYESDLNERTRLRLQGTRASVRTNGREAIRAARRILEIDPMDLGAAASLAYYEQVYGWQIDPPSIDERSYAENAVKLDSTNLPALTLRASHAVALGDTSDMRLQLERFERSDTTSALGRDGRTALRALLATDADFSAMLLDLASQSASGRIATARRLRVGNVERYEAYLDALASASDPDARSLARGEEVRLNLSRGHADRVGSAVDAGEYDAGEFDLTVRRYLLAAGLAGLVDSATAAKSADYLAASFPADSALAQFERRPVWWTGWLLGAWNAQSGDTAVSHTWIRAIGTLPPGGTSEDYVGSLQADIRARLAARRADHASALQHARTAYDLWTIHTENQFEVFPEPAMRMHLAAQYRAAGQRDSARALLYSLVPPTTWMGFLTARARYELGELELERSNLTAAVFHFLQALALWEDGGAAAEPWVSRIRERLAGTVER